MTGTHQRSTQAVLDSHVHFWDPRRISYPWLSEAPDLDRPFTPGDFAALRPMNSSAIFVEAGRAEQHAAAEIEWVRAEADQYPWVVGAVAHVPLEDPASAETTIRRYADDPLVVGVRRNLQDEPAGFMEQADFRAGVRQLGDVGMPFDACVREHQLPELSRLADACPQTTIVLDHLGKPKSTDPGPRRGGRRCDGWQNTRTSCASFPAWRPSSTRARLGPRRSHCCARPWTCSVPNAACTGATGRC